MARKILFSEIPASFREGVIHLAHPIKGVRKIEVTSTLENDYLQFKGWGWPNELPLNGAVIAGELFILLEIDPEDRDLIRDPSAPVLPR